MLKSFLYPKIKRSDFQSIVKFAIIGSIIAGIYGIIHDQITYSISPEYFTKIKFNQFQLINFGFNEVIFVSIIGSIATGAVGFFVGWFLGRYYIPEQESSLALKNIKIGFLIVLLSSLFCASIAYLYGIYANPNAHLAFWKNTFEIYKIDDGWSFVRVAYIHYGSYFGGLLGIIATYTFVKK